MMKGNQGLEALAALCGGRPKAADTPGGGAPIAATSNAGGSGTAPSSPQRTSPRASAAASPVVVKPPSSAATVAAANQLLIRQAAERNAAEAASQQQHPAVAISGATPITTDSGAAPGAAVIGNLTPQQISQAIVAAANSQGGRLDPAVAQSLLYPAALRGAAAGVAAVEAATPVAAGAAAGNNILANTMQQLVIQQYLQAQANAQQQQVQQQQQAQAQAAATAAATSGHQQAALLAMTMAAGKAGQPQQHFITTGAPAPIPTATTATTSNASDAHRSTPGAQQAQAQAQALLQHAAQQQQLNTAGYTSIKPTNTGIHQAIQQQYHLANGATAATAAGSAANLPSMIKIAAAGGRILPSTDIAPQNSVAMRAGGANANAMDDSLGSKKQQKRAANRRSAQLSRKRKKQFIEELKEENDDLRRKEQILRAIPDLIVVFDSSGRLGFVSESVGRFLSVPPDELEGTSFWDLICEESVRMLKAAFMDSLAAREADSDTAVLGSGVWELRLKDKNSDFIIVTLNGVVHFKGDAPECVCCIRPVGEEQRPKKRQEQDAQKQQQKKSTPSAQQLKTNDSNNAESGNGADKSNNLTVSCSDGASRSSDGSSNGTQQSVLGRHGGMSLSEQDDAATDAKKRNKKFRRVTASSEEGDNENRSNSSNDNNDNINNLDADGTNNSVRISDGDSNDGIESD